LIWLLISGKRELYTKSESKESTKTKLFSFSSKRQFCLEQLAKPVTLLRILTWS